MPFHIFHPPRHKLLKITRQDPRMVWKNHRLCRKFGRLNSQFAIRRIQALSQLEDGPHHPLIPSCWLPAKTGKCVGVYGEWTTPTYTYHMLYVHLGKLRPRIGDTPNYELWQVQLKKWGLTTGSGDTPGTPIFGQTHIGLKRQQFHTTRTTPSRQTNKCWGMGNLETLIEWILKTASKDKKAPLSICSLSGCPSVLRSKLWHMSRSAVAWPLQPCRWII